MINYFITNPVLFLQILLLIAIVVLFITFITKNQVYKGIWDDVHTTAVVFSGSIIISAIFIVPILYPLLLIGYGILFVSILIYRHIQRKAEFMNKLKEM